MSKIRAVILENKIWILTEKPQPEVYTITVRGTFASLTNHLFANKKKLYLGVSQYRRFVRYMTLQRQGAAHLGSLTFQPSQPWIKADIVESNVTMARLRITLDVPPAITSFHEEVAAYGCDPNDFVRIPIMGEVRPAIYPSRSIIYVDAEKSYEVCFEFYNGRAKTLTKHEFIGDGLDVFEIIDHLNIDNRPSLMVGIKKLTTEQPVLTGELLLFFEGEALPVEVKFISANANAPGNN